MTLLKEFTTHIAALTGLVLDQNLWAASIQPYAPDRAAVVMAFGGIPSTPVLDGNVGEYIFQVVCRDNFSHDAHDLAMLIHQAIGDLPGADLDEWFVCVCQAEGEPSELGYDEKQRFEWAGTYAVRAYHKAVWAAA